MYIYNKPSGFMVTAEGIESSKGIFLAFPKVFDVMLGIFCSPHRTFKVQSCKKQIAVTLKIFFRQNVYLLNSPDFHWYMTI